MGAFSNELARAGECDAPGDVRVLYIYTLKKPGVPRPGFFFLCPIGTGM
jgi:hypothetical protein